VTLRRTLLAASLVAATVAIAGLAIDAPALGYQALAVTFGLLAAWFAIAGTAGPRRARWAVLVALCALLLSTALDAWAYQSPEPLERQDTVWSAAWVTTEQLQAGVPARRVRLRERCRPQAVPVASNAHVRRLASTGALDTYPGHMGADDSASSASSARLTRRPIVGRALGGE
jgi:hypothetical protein